MEPTKLQQQLNNLVFQYGKHSIRKDEIKEENTKIEAHLEDITEAIIETKRQIELEPIPDPPDNVD